jgi:hypothetical protein
VLVGLEVEGLGVELAKGAEHLLAPDEHAITLLVAQAALG